MCASDAPDDDTYAFDLADFISEHSELFVAMGVFGGLAIYISQSATGDTPDAELIIKTGYVSAFGLSILMLYLIYTKLVNKFGDYNTFYRAHFRLQNAPLTMFSLFSAMLILSVSFVLTQHEPVIFLLLLTGTTVVGLGIVTRVLYAVGRRVPNAAIWRIPMLFLTSLVLLLLSFYLQTRVLNRLETSTIQELSLSDPVPVAITVGTLLVETISSLAAMGVIASFIAVPLVVVDKIRGKSPYDEAG